jgi:hypothetical protein
MIWKEIDKNGTVTSCAWQMRGYKKKDPGDEIEGKRTKRQAENQVDGSSKERDMEKRGKKLMQVQQDREGEDRDRWRFLCNSRLKNWKRLKKEDVVSSCQGS